MLTIGIAVAAGVFFWLERYDISFWIIVAALTNGLLAVLWSILNPSWYMRKQLEAGMVPTGDMRGLIIAKLILFAILVPAAWYLGMRAGYFPQVQN